MYYFAGIAMCAFRFTFPRRTSYLALNIIATKRDNKILQFTTTPFKIPALKINGRWIDIPFDFSQVCFEPQVLPVIVSFSEFHGTV